MAVAEAAKSKDTNIAQLCRKASEQFNLEVKDESVHKNILCGGSSIYCPGPKGKFTDEEMEALEVTLLLFLALSQANCHEEVRRNKIISIIQGNIQKVRQQHILKDAGSFYRHVQRRLAAFLQLHKEVIVEMRPQFWMTFPNLTVWYDGWESFVLFKGFALKNDNNEIHFRGSAMYRIVNLDEKIFLWM